MVDILRIGTSGLLASQRALATTSHNVANASTPGFSRQRVDLAAIPAQGFTGTGPIGRGVEVANVRRVFDQFLVQQVRNHDSGFQRLDTLRGLIDQVAGLLGDDETGVSPALDRFFAAAQDVADAPSSLPAREVLLEAAESLALRFQSTGAQLRELRDHANDRLRDAVDEVNALAGAIVDANQAIRLARATSGDAGVPGDLLDHRDRLLRDLAQRVPVETVTQDDGTLNVFIGNGLALVGAGRANPLEVGRSAADPEDLVVRFEGQPARADLGKQLNGGMIGGLLDFRGEVLAPAQNALGLVAVALAEGVNAQHQRGIDLQGDAGGAFFDAGAPRALPAATNAGDAEVEVGIADVSALVPSEYSLRVTASGFELRRLSDGQTTSLPALPAAVDGLQITMSGSPAEGDSFLIQPVRAGATELELALFDPSTVAAAAPVRVEADLGNAGSGEIALAGVDDPQDPNLRRAADIVFTAPDSFDLVDAASGATLAAGQPYTSGAGIVFDGIEVSLRGAPVAGDRFQVRDNAGGVGDNANALALADLQTAPALLGGSTDLQGAVGRMVAEVGARGSRNRDSLEAQEALLDQAVAAREAVSGVNLDEEAADLLRFQRSYEAAAQVVRVADSLFDTLLSAIGR